jgi:hypothetical protein
MWGFASELVEVRLTLVFAVGMASSLSDMELAPFIKFDDVESAETGVDEFVAAAARNADDGAFSGALGGSFTLARASAQACRMAGAGSLAAAKIYNECGRLCGGYMMRHCMNVPSHTHVSICKHA